jgi:flagellar biogenesis protein FliO
MIGVRAWGVIALALFATSLTGLAAADPVPDGPAPPAATAASTPLPVRPSVPLTLEPAPASPGLGWKLLALVAAAGGGVWIWKKRAGRIIDKRIPELRILGRTVAGPRCELLLVEIEGQRLLLGVTPQSVQNLYIIAEPPTEDAAEAKAVTPSQARRSSRSSALDIDAIEGQARGLLGHGDRS